MPTLPPDWLACLPRLREHLTPDMPPTVDELRDIGAFWLRWASHVGDPDKVVYQLCLDRNPDTIGWSGTRDANNGFRATCHACRGCRQGYLVSVYLDLVWNLLPSVSRTLHVLWDVETATRSPKTRRSRTTTTWKHFTNQALERGQRLLASSIIGGRAVGRAVVLSSGPLTDTKRELYTEPVDFETDDAILEFLAGVALMQPEQADGWRVKGTKRKPTKEAKFYLGPSMKWWSPKHRHQALRDAGIRCSNPSQDNREPRNVNPVELCRQGPVWLRQQWGLIKPSPTANDEMRKRGWTQDEIDAAFPEIRHKSLSLSPTGFQRKRPV